MTTQAIGQEAGSDDVLAPFRKPGAPRAPRQSHDQEKPHSPPGYRAFGLARGPAKPLRLEFRTATGLAVARAYALLTEIAYDRDHYSIMDHGKDSRGILTHRHRAAELALCDGIVPGGPYTKPL
jgi:hypothetical protein